MAERHNWTLLDVFEEDPANKGNAGTEDKRLPVNLTESRKERKAGEKMELSKKKDLR